MDITTTTDPVAAFTAAAAKLRTEAAAAGVRGGDRTIGLRRNSRRLRLITAMNGLRLTNTLVLGRVIAEGTTLEALREAARDGRVRLIPDRMRRMSEDGGAVMGPR